MLLADDRVEEVKPSGHPAAWPGRQVALGVNQDVALLVHRGVEHPGDEHVESVEIPGLPVLVLEPEHRPAPVHTIDVDAERLLEVFVEQSQHLERLVHLYRPLLQPVMISQGGHATDMDSGHRRAAEIHRDLVRLPVRQCIEDPLPARRHGGRCLKGRHRSIPSGGLCSPLQASGASGPGQRDGTREGGMARFDLGEKLGWVMTLYAFAAAPGSDYDRHLNHTCTSIEVECPARLGMIR